VSVVVLGLWHARSADEEVLCVPKQHVMAREGARGEDLRAKELPIARHALNIRR